MENEQFPSIPFSKVNFDFFAEPLLSQGVHFFFNKRLFKKIYSKIKVSREICRFDKKKGRFVNYATTPFSKVNLKKIIFSLQPQSFEIFLIKRWFKNYYNRKKKRTIPFNKKAVLFFLLNSRP
ncbi:hypothetical protein [Sutcliffiella horikoshii]|uniref:hypothetical protein n=1 Tax=Sutcliffiella horikoshii TaxID=79883 RepID=UPI003CEE863E